MDTDASRDRGMEAPALRQPSSQMPTTGITYRNILVPLDGSAASEEALPAAAGIALRTGAGLTLVHVREDRDAADALDAAYPASLRGDPRIPASLDVTTELLTGSVQDALLAQAVAGRADLIVMTSRGRGGMSRALFGSVADAVIRGATVPVLIARTRTQAPSTADTTGHLPRPRRALLPLDGSESSERIVPHALALTGTEDVHYVLLRVRPALMPDGRLEPGPLLPLPEAPIEDGYLSSAAARIAAHQVLVSTRTVTHAWDAEAVLQQAAEDDVDLIALTAHRVSGADRALFGSVADQVTRRAPCSVFVVPAPTATDQRR